MAIPLGFQLRNSFKWLNSASVPSISQHHIYHPNISRMEFNLEWKNGRMEYVSREMTVNEKIAEHLEHLTMLCARGKFTNKILSKSIIDAAYRNCANFPHMPSEVKANLAIFNALGDPATVNHFYCDLQEDIFLYLSDQMKKRLTKAGRFRKRGAEKTFDYGDSLKNHAAITAKKLLISLLETKVATDNPGLYDLAKQILTQINIILSDRAGTCKDQSAKTAQKLTVCLLSTNEATDHPGLKDLCLQILNQIDVLLSDRICF